MSVTYLRQKDLFRKRNTYKKQRALQLLEIHQRAELTPKPGWLTVSTSALVPDVRVFGKSAVKNAVSEDDKKNMKVQAPSLQDQWTELVLKRF